MSSSAAMKDVPTLLIVGMGLSASVHLLKVVHSHIRIGVSVHGAWGKG